MLVSADPKTPPWISLEVFRKTTFISATGVVARQTLTIHTVAQSYFPSILISEYRKVK